MDLRVFDPCAAVLIAGIAAGLLAVGLGF